MTKDEQMDIQEIKERWIDVLFYGENEALLVQAQKDIEHLLSELERVRGERNYYHRGLFTSGHVQSCDMMIFHPDPVRCTCGLIPYPERGQNK